MLTDYKFQIIRRNGGTTYCKIAFFEGQMGFDNGELVYQRKKRLKSEEHTYQSEKTDDELRFLMNIELAKDRARNGIKQQINA